MTVAGTASAITNAVFHATGLRIRSLPMTAEWLPLTFEG